VTLAAVREQLIQCFHICRWSHSHNSGGISTGTGPPCSGSALHDSAISGFILDEPCPMWRVLEHNSATICIQGVPRVLRQARWLPSSSDVMLLMTRSFANHELMVWLRNNVALCHHLPCDVLLHGTIIYQLAQFCTHRWEGLLVSSGQFVGGWNTVICNLVVATVQRCQGLRLVSHH